MFVMLKEPITDMSVADVKTYFANNNAEKDLADVYAIAHNMFWWIEDDLYDYEEDTPEYKNICTIIDEWQILMNDYENKIIDILINEGIDIPVTGRIKVLEIFMKRFGYINGDGWWIKQNTKDK